MKPSYSPNTERFRTLVTVSVAVVFFLSTANILAAQEGAGTQESPSQRIYRQAYEAAMVDSVITPDELQMLKSLQQALGLHEDIIDEAVGETLRPLPPGPQQSGRWTLIAQNMVWGMYLYGGGIPYVLDVEDIKWYLGGVMLSLGTTFYLTWKYTENMDLPEARSQMQRYGGLVGLRYGQTISGLLGLDFREEVYYYDYYDEPEQPEPLRGHYALMMASVPLGTYLGDRLYRRWTPSTGQAYALSLNGAMTASWINSLYSQLVPPPPAPEIDYSQIYTEDCWALETEEERQACEQAQWEREAHLWDQYEQDRKVWGPKYAKYSSIRRLFEVAGYPLGTYLGRRFFGDRQYSFGDAAMLCVGWGAGCIYGLLLADLIDIDTWETVWLLGNTTAVGGVLAVNRYIRGYDYTFGQTALMGLGAGAGAASAVGVGVILEIEKIKYYEAAVIGGSLAGFFLTRRIINPRLELATAGRSGRQPRISLSLQPAMVGRAVLPTLGIEARW